jgi:hypothetical protein
MLNIADLFELCGELLALISARRACEATRKRAQEPKRKVDWEAEHLRTLSYSLSIPD